MPLASGSKGRGCHLQVEWSDRGAKLQLFLHYTTRRPTSLPAVKASCSSAQLAGAAYPGGGSDSPLLLRGRPDDDMRRSITRCTATGAAVSRAATSGPCDARRTSARTRFTEEAAGCAPAAAAVAAPSPAETAVPARLPPPRPTPATASGRRVLDPAFRNVNFARTSCVLSDAAASEVSRNQARPMHNHVSNTETQTHRNLNQQH
jgi:hypothetical protein